MSDIRPLHPVATGINLGILLASLLIVLIAAGVVYTALAQATEAGRAAHVESLLLAWASLTAASGGLARVVLSVSGQAAAGRLRPAELTVAYAVPLAAAVVGLGAYLALRATLLDAGPEAAAAQVFEIGLVALGAGWVTRSLVPRGRPDEPRPAA